MQVKQGMRPGSYQKIYIHNGGEVRIIEFSRLAIHPNLGNSGSCIEHLHFINSFCCSTNTANHCDYRQVRANQLPCLIAWLLIAGDVPVMSLISTSHDQIHT
jgi:hypothetical protein